MIGQDLVAALWPGVLLCGYLTAQGAMQPADWC